MTRLSDIMTRQLASVSPSATLREVAELMKREDIGNVLVMEGEELRGIVTDRDLVIRALADGEDSGASVGAFATADVTTLDADTDVQEAARLMAERQIRRLPVTENGRVVGIVSLADLSVRTSGDADQQALEGISQPG